MSRARTASIQPYQGSHLLPAFEHAIVGEAMHAGVLTCAPDASLVDAARVMATHHVHCVAVLGIEPNAREQTQPVWGIVSDLDLVGAVQAEGTEAPTAGEIAATAPVTVDVRAPLAAAARTMTQYDVHHLVVVSGEDPRPVGILSSLDIAGVVAWGRA